jgi:hypothetical protein
MSEMDFPGTAGFELNVPIVGVFWFAKNGAVIDVLSLSRFPVAGRCRLLDIGLNVLGHDSGDAPCPCSKDLGLSDGWGPQMKSRRGLVRHLAHAEMQLFEMHIHDRPIAADDRRKRPSVDCDVSTMKKRESRANESTPEKSSDEI